MTTSISSDVALAAFRPLSVVAVVAVWGVVLWPAGFGAPGWLALLVGVPCGLAWLWRRLRWDALAVGVALGGGLASLALGALPLVAMVVGFGAATLAALVLNREGLLLLLDVF